MFKKKREHGSTTSPRAIIRPPPSFDEADTAPRVPTSPIRSPSQDSDFAAPSSPINTTNKLLIRPPEVPVDVDTSRQELALGKKAVLRPIRSPEKPKADFFSRISFRKTYSPVNIPPAERKDTQDTITNDEDYVPTRSAPKSLENVSEIDVIARIAERRGWGKTLPTNNPHCMHALLKESNPFKKIRNSAKLTAQEVHEALANAIYCTPKSQTTAGKYRFQRGDVVVAGCPRSGQTPVLQILASLRAKEYVPAVGLVEAVGWVEGPFKAQTFQKGRKILKTHMPMQMALKGEHGKLVEHKVIAVIRDPGDVRLSWYRHARRLAKKCSQISLDKIIGLAPFADAPIPMPLLTKQQEMDIEGKEPEYWVAWALKAAVEYPECVLLVFYEELLTDPCKVVEKIAKFTNGMEEEVEKKRNAASSGSEEVEDPRQADLRRRQEAEIVVNIATALMNDTHHPNATKRNGSSGQAAVCFPRDSLERFDERWEKIVGPSKMGKFASYPHLYQSVLKERYIFAEEPLIAAGSGGMFRRVSNLTAHSETTSNSVSKADSSTIKLRKQSSSNEEHHPVVRRRKFGGSFLSFIGGGSGHASRERSESNKLPLPERPIISNFPQVKACIDPDDSDSEASGK